MNKTAKFASIPAAAGLILGGAFLAAPAAYAAESGDSTHVNETSSSEETTHTTSTFLNELFGGSVILNELGNSGDSAVGNGDLNLDAPDVNVGDIGSGTDVGGVNNGNTVEAPVQAPIASGNDFPVVSGNETTAPVASGNDTSVDAPVQAPVDAPVQAPVEAPVGNGNSGSNDIGASVNDTVDSALEGVTGDNGLLNNVLGD